MVTPPPRRERGGPASFLKPSPPREKGGLASAHPPHLGTTQETSSLLVAALSPRKMAAAAAALVNPSHFNAPKRAGGGRERENREKSGPGARTLSPRAFFQAAPKCESGQRKSFPSSN